MKKLPFIILLLLTINASSQNFLPFHKDRPAYYNFNGYDIFYTQAGIFIDSFKVLASDTVFYHYPIIDYDNGNGCYLKAHDTSFVGDHSIRTANGDDEFFNRYGDTIFFKNNSAVNDNWSMLNLGDGNKIVATVQSINLESILGVNDSVKKISLQAEDSSGNFISNIFNNKLFKIGKSMGFVSGYSLFHFPFDTLSFSLVGIENPSLGLSSENLTPEKLFDFDVGDEFDFYGFHTTNPTYFQITCRIEKILSKEIIGDTLRYNINYSSHWFWFDWGDSTLGSASYSMLTDIVTTDYSFLLLKPFETLALDPYGNSAAYLWFEESNYFPGKTLKKVNSSNNAIAFGDDCFLPIPADFNPIEKYAGGLGNTGYYAFNGTDYLLDTLVYFKKDTVEWGSPVTCPFGTGTNGTSLKKGVNFFPNPARSQLFLSGNFSPSQTHFTLLNSLGEEMKLTQLSNQFGSISFDVHSLPPGLYVLQVKSEEEVVNLKFVKN